MVVGIVGAMSTQMTTVTPVMSRTAFFRRNANKATLSRALFTLESLFFSSGFFLSLKTKRDGINVTTNMKLNKMPRIRINPNSCRGGNSDTLKEPNPKAVVMAVRRMAIPTVFMLVTAA